MLCADLAVLSCRLLRLISLSWPRPIDGRPRCNMCCLRGPAARSPLMWWLQNCPQMSQEDMQRDALSHVRDWKFGVAEAIQHTPLGRITRSRITDRCGFLLVCTADITWRCSQTHSPGAHYLQLHH